MAVGGGCRCGGGRRWWLRGRAAVAGCGSRRWLGGRGGLVLCSALGGLSVTVQTVMLDVRLPFVGVAVVTFVEKNYGLLGQRGTAKLNF